MTRFVAVVAAALCALSLAAPAGAEPPLRLTLAQAVSIAAGKSPSVTIAQLRAQEAAARVGQSRAALLPTLTGQATLTDRTFNLYALGISLPVAPGSQPYPALQGPVYDTEARLKLSQPILDLASWNKLRGARLGALGARADLGVTSESAAQNAALAYLRAVRADAVARAREEDIALARALLALAEAQLSAGTSPAIDVTRARTQVASSQGAVLIARNQRDRSRIDLARSLGMDASALLEPADTLGAELGGSEAPLAESEAVTFATEHREELRGEEARLAKARADRSAMSWERAPRVDVSADWGRSGEHYGDGIGTYAYALAVTLPLLDGFKREGRIAEQGAIVRESEVRSRDARDQITAEVRNALLDLASGTEQQAVATERLNLALEEVSQATERFTNGVAGNIEVINAQSSLVRARDADIDARFAVASARVALARAAGVARNIH
jgi:outer membrane protein TolC